MTEERPSSLNPNRSDILPAVNAPPPRAKTAKCRVTVPLDAHRTVTIIGAGLDLDGFIGALEDALNRARRARNLRVSLATFVQMLADQSRAS